MTAPGDPRGRVLEIGMTGGTFQVTF